MTAEELKRRVEGMLDVHLNLEDGEMVMPLKGHEIADLGRAIRDLVAEAARDGLTR